MSGHEVVIDASVLVKSVIVEDLSDRAVALIEQAVPAGVRLVGPPLLRTEATNAVYQRFRRGDIAENDADTAVAHVLARNVEVVNPANLLSAGYAFARRHQLKNIYDCLYVVLAQELATELWTADHRLFTAMASVAPWVRWLGDYPGP